MLERRLLVVCHDERLFECVMVEGSRVSLMGLDVDPATLNSRSMFDDKVMKSELWMLRSGAG